MAEQYTSTRAITTTINEIDPDNQRIDNDTEVVTKQRVAKSTR